MNTHGALHCAAGSAYGPGGYKLYSTLFLLVLEAGMSGMIDPYAAAVFITRSFSGISRPILIIIPGHAHAANQSHGFLVLPVDILQHILQQYCMLFYYKLDPPRITK